MEQKKLSWMIASLFALPVVGSHAVAQQDRRSVLRRREVPRQAQRVLRPVGVEEDRGAVAAMRTIIAGSRGITDIRHVQRAMAAAREQFGIVPTLVLSGCAPGVDTLGEEWAKANNVPVELHPAQWALHGHKRAGPLRNAKMAHACDAVVAVWDGKSPGTADMIRRATVMGRKVCVWWVAP